MINYTLDEASKILNKELGFDVTRSHLLQLALQGKIALSMLYSGRARAYEGGKDEEDKEIYGWFDIPPKFLEKLVNNEPCNISMLFGENSSYFLLNRLPATFENIFIVGQRFDVLLKMNIDRKSSKEVNTYEPKQRRQERLILEAIKALHYDPLNYPSSPAGMPGVKSQVRVKVTAENKSDFVSASVFDKAWDRLLAQNEINMSDQPTP